MSDNIKDSSEVDSSSYVDSSSSVDSSRYVDSSSYVYSSSYVGSSRYVGSSSYVYSSRSVYSSSYVGSSSYVYSSRYVGSSRDVYSSRYVGSSRDVYSSRYVYSSSYVYSSREIKRSENVLFCFGIKLKEFWAFNKDVGEERYNALTSLTSKIFDGYKLKVTEWVEEEDMTDDEKLAQPNFFTNKGYLKEREYKDAWALRWEELPNERKDQLLAIPEFDADVFLDITGIDVRKSSEDEDVLKAIELLTKKGKLKDGKILNQ